MKKNLAPDNFGARLQSYRALKGITGQELAKIIGVSQGSLSEIENGKREPSAKVFYGIIKNTDIDIKWLVTGKGAEPKKEDYSFYEELEQWARETGRSENTQWMRNQIESFFPMFKEWKKRKEEGEDDQPEQPSSMMA